jgi:hypothetical protein
MFFVLQSLKGRRQSFIFLNGYVRLQINQGLSKRMETTRFTGVSKTLQISTMQKIIFVNRFQLKRE